MVTGFELSTDATHHETTSQKNALEWLIGKHEPIIAYYFFVRYQSG